MEKFEFIKAHKKIVTTMAYIALCTPKKNKLRRFAALSRHENKLSPDDLKINKNIQSYTHLNHPDLHYLYVSGS